MEGFHSVSSHGRLAIYTQSNSELITCHFTGTKSEKSDYAHAFQSFLPTQLQLWKLTPCSAIETYSISYICVVGGVLTLKPGAWGLSTLLCLFSKRPWYQCVFSDIYIVIAKRVCRIEMYLPYGFAISKKASDFIQTAWVSFTSLQHVKTNENYFLPILNSFLIYFKKCKGRCIS